MPDSPRIPLNQQERALFNLLHHLYPGGAIHRLNGPGDREAQEVGARLVEAGVIERVEETVVEDGETIDVACYRLRDDLVADAGGTPTPDLN